MKFAFLFLLIFGPSAFGHPVAYKDAIGVMTWNQSFMTDDWITWSFRSDAALAFRHMRFDMPEGRMQFYAPQFDFLLKRWNETDLQANIYLYGAYGTQTLNKQSHGAGLGGFEMDAEDRKYFAMAKYEKMWGDLGPEFYHSELRLGVAPYEAEITEVASWFMLQYQHHPMLIRQEAVTPIIRLFYKSVLLETGVSTDGDWMINFMFHF